MNITKNYRCKQQGVALITALIIVSIATSIAAMIIYRQQIQIRLSSNISALEQTYQYAYGMEDFAGTILRRSLEDQPDFVSLNDNWYSENGLVLPITGGFMTGKLFDLQARINVNSLIRPRTPKKTQHVNSNEPKLTEEEFVEQLNNNEQIKSTDTKIEYDDIASLTKTRLTELIRILDEQQDMGPPENFSVILKDWIDKDQDNGNAINPEEDDGSDVGVGAETAYYQSIEPAYYSANTEMISPTELRLIKNMKEKFYKPITSEISTLPTTKNNSNEATQTPINVNTASDKVLRALGFTPDAVENILEVRKDKPFETLEAFTELDVVQEVLKTKDYPEGTVDPLDLSVSSEYFLLEGKVEINNSRLFINSILWRNKSGQVSVIMRDFSNPQSISKIDN